MNKMYIFTLIIILLLSYLYDRSKTRQQKKLCVIFIFLFLVCISGLRLDTTLYSDEWNYRYIFQSYEGISFSTLDLNFINEPGFILLNWVLANITHNPQSLIFICALLTNLSFVLFIQKYSKNFTFSIFIYITAGTFFTSMNIIRQYIAIAIILLGFKHLLSKNLKIFTIYVFIAFLFHKSAIIALFLYFIINSIIIEKHKIVSFLIILFVLTNFNNILDLFSTSLYDEYVQTFNESGYGVGLMRLIFWSFFYIVIIWKQKYLIKKTNLQTIFFNSIFISWSILLISIQYVFIMRLDYFQSCSLILIPSIPYYFKKSERINIKIIIYILFFIYGLYLTSGMNIHNLLFTFI